MTSFANPLRWSDSKHNIVPTKGSYCVGVYETIYNMLNFTSHRDTYWDRTWISAFIYGTISQSEFQYITCLYKDNMSNIKIVFLDTNIKICKQRFKDSKYKEYVNNFDWDGLRSKFLFALSILKKNGFKVRILKNYGVKK